MSSFEPENQIFTMSAATSRYPIMDPQWWVSRFRTPPMMSICDSTGMVNLAEQGKETTLATFITWTYLFYSNSTLTIRY